MAKNRYTCLENIENISVCYQYGDNVNPTRFVCDFFNV